MSRQYNYSVSTMVKRAAILPALLMLPVFLSGCDWAKADNIAQRDEAEAIAPVDVSFWGTPRQSATILGKTAPNAQIDAGGIVTKSDENGFFIFGFDRDAPETMTVTVTTADKHSSSRVFKIAKRDYDVTTINGLPPQTVNPPPEAMAKIQADSVVKQGAFNSHDETMKGFLETFRWPLSQVIVTSNWGAQRSLNGNLQRPHYGVDLAAPIGTPIVAPATGKIILAQPGMFYEGGMVGIDHGQGLITNYLHMSKINVQPGQIVHAGDKIGEVGKEGRATGPHLCWRMRWRGRQLDPTALTKAKPELATNIDQLALK